jgi:Tfp pilus assembly PilM family ATPase
MSLFASLSQVTPPPVAVEFTANRVSAASLDVRSSGAVVTAHASEALPPGALAPSLTALNVQDRPAVTGALRRVLDEVGRPRRVGIVVPDLVAKVSLIRFDQVPARAQDLDQLVRWQMKKTAPFPIEDAQVSYVRGAAAADGHEFVVSVARRDVIAEYEAVCDEAGAHAGIVDISTFNVINAVLAGARPPAADWLLVNIAPVFASIAILRGPHLIFFRNRAADTEGTLADLVHQTAMYYEDRLKGGGFTQVLLAGGSAADAQGHDAAGELRRSLQERLGSSVQAVDPRSAAAIGDRIGASPALLDTLAPLVGLLLRYRGTEVAS